MMILKEFSRIVCVSLFSYQGSLFLLSFDSSFSLSHSFLFVKNFFKFFSKLFLMKFFVFVDDLSTLSQVGSFVNHFFDFFKFKILKNQKRRRRDLNPRAALTTYTLSRGTSSAS